MGHEQCLAETAAQIAQVAVSTLVIEPDLETAIYCNGMRTANSLVILTIMESLLVVEMEAMKPLIMNSVGCASSLDVLSFYLQSSISRDYPYTTADRARIIPNHNFGHLR